MKNADSTVGPPENSRQTPPQGDNSLPPLDKALVRALARKHAQAYSNRADPTNASYGFSELTLIAFVRELLECVATERLIEQVQSAAMSPDPGVDAQGNRVAKPSLNSLNPLDSDWVEQNVSGNPILKQAMRNHVEAAQPIEEALRDVYEATRKYLRFVGVDRQKWTEAYDEMDRACEVVKILDGGGDLEGTVYEKPKRFPDIAWKTLAESALALVKTGEAIKELTDKYGLDEAEEKWGEDLKRKVDKTSLMQRLLYIAMHGDRGNSSKMLEDIEQAFKDFGGEE